jgi:beta-galactosidase
MSLSSISGKSLVIASEKLSFNASHYSTAALLDTPHDFELKTDGATHLTVDYRQSGVGSASCGPSLAAKFRLSERSFAFSFNILPTESANLTPELEFANLTKK